MVLALAGAGANVIIVSRKQDACEKLAEKVTSSTGRDCLPLGCNVGHWSDIESMLGRAYDRFGHIDIAVNNAGMSPLYPSLSDMTESLYDKVFDVNLKGPFRLSVLVGTRMTQGGGGSIINISSTGARHPEPTALPYSMAKAGLNTMTEGLARAFGPSVRVNAIMAGPFLTDIASHWPPAMKTSIERRSALKRAGRPEEISGTVLYLAGSASSYTTGAVITVDGGAD
jgi:NAD(P)-dependent dehydrogenase (short-subunit alcohol dehydrogenase family)